MSASNIHAVYNDYCNGAASKVGSAVRSRHRERTLMFICSAVCLSICICQSRTFRMILLPFVTFAQFRSRIHLHNILVIVIIIFKYISDMMVHNRIQKERQDKETKHATYKCSIINYNFFICIYLRIYLYFAKRRSYNLPFLKVFTPSALKLRQYGAIHMCILLSPSIASSSWSPRT